MADVDDAVLQLWFGANGTTHYFADPMCAYRFNVPGSWTETFFAGDRAPRIRHHEGLLRALRSFDEETGYKWHDAVDYCVTYQQEYEILRLKNDVSALNRPPYRSLYKELPLKRRIRMHLAHLGILKR
jgi:hypothetical protein